MTVRVLVGDMRERLRDLPDASVDSCVTDPPYHLTSIVKRFGASDSAPVKVGATGAYARASRGFMGQTWDGGDVAFRADTWAEVLRALKPGAHLVAFGGTRTYHRLTCAIEDAGFEVRDQLAWVYGSGFPKSHDVGDGWGTALKPAWEPICLARKPLVGTVAATIAAHGTGGLNIDGCRVAGASPSLDRREVAARTGGGIGNAGRDRDSAFVGNLTDPQRKRAMFLRERSGEALGRWPANLLHDGSDEVVALLPSTKGGRGQGARRGHAGVGFGMVGGERPPGPDDSGSAARFFYCAKASRADRGEGNAHPTVKPEPLMRWLCRLVTPVGGTVLDPFAGSGSTLVAAALEGFGAIGVELSPDYVAIAERRVRDRVGLFADLGDAA